MDLRLLNYYLPLFTSSLLFSLLPSTVLVLSGSGISSILSITLVLMDSCRVLFIISFWTCLYLLRIFLILLYLWLKVYSLTAFGESGDAAGD